MMTPAGEDVERSIVTPIRSGKLMKIGDINPCDGYLERFFMIKLGKTLIRIDPQRADMQLPQSDVAILPSVAVASRLVGRQARTRLSRRDAIY
jgi:hypothetical protein